MGARRIWGILKTCTFGAVASTISSLCPAIAGEIQIGRKYRDNDSSQVTHRWIVIHGEETSLVKLQNMWENVLIRPLGNWRNAISPRGPRLFLHHLLWQLLKKVISSSHTIVNEQDLSAANITGNTLPPLPSHD